MTKASEVWMEGGPCPSCGAPVKLLDKLPWPKFRHSDFSPFAEGPSEIFVCSRCGMGGVSLPEELTELKELFVSEGYVDRDLPIHNVRPPGADGPVPAPDHQVELLQDGLPQAPSVLDIGCFDGRLLHAFRARFPEGRYVGYDVGERNRYLFDGTDIEYVSGTLDRVEGPFNLITMSHSLQYEPNLAGLFGSIDRLLGADGTLYLQVPDVGLKPTGLLLGDVHHHFSAISLANLTAQYGFKSQLLKQHGFPRDAIVTARRDDGTAQIESGGEVFLERACEELQAFVQRITAVLDQGPWHILGTTIDAAFAAYVLGAQAGDFIDESCVDDQQVFQGRPVRHPESLGRDERALLPIGLKATSVLERFKCTYDATFVLV